MEPDDLHVLTQRAGLRRMKRGRPGALLARRTRTMKLCSFDARTRGSTRLPLRMKQGIEIDARQWKIN